MNPHEELAARWFEYLQCLKFVCHLLQSELEDPESPALDALKTLIVDMQSGRPARISRKTFVSYPRTPRNEFRALYEAVCALLPDESEDRQKAIGRKVRRIVTKSLAGDLSKLSGLLRQSLRKEFSLSVGKARRIVLLVFHNLAAGEYRKLLAEIERQPSRRPSGQKQTRAGRPLKAAVTLAAKLLAEGMPWRQVQAEVERDRGKALTTDEAYTLKNSAYRRLRPR